MSECKHGYNIFCAECSKESETEITRLREENEQLKYKVGEQQATINAQSARLSKDDCMFCNYLERGDCHVQKQELREREKEAKQHIINLIHTVGKLKENDSVASDIITADKRAEIWLDQQLFDHIPDTGK